MNKVHFKINKKTYQNSSNSVLMKKVFFSGALVNHEVLLGTELSYNFDNALHHESAKLNQEITVQRQKE